jgi:hypothetical protein
MGKEAGVPAPTREFITTVLTPFADRPRRSTSSLCCWCSLRWLRFQRRRRNWRPISTSDRRIDSN